MPIAAHVPRWNSTHPAAASAAHRRRRNSMAGERNSRLMRAYWENTSSAGTCSSGRDHGWPRRSSAHTKIELDVQRHPTLRIFVTAEKK